MVYPCLTTALDTPAAQQHAHAPLLTTEDMHFYLKEYAPNSQDWRDLRLAPLLATDFSDMPTSFVAVAEYDPLVMTVISLPKNWNKQEYRASSI